MSIYHKVIICPKKSHAGALALAEKIAAWLEDRRVNASIRAVTDYTQLTRDGADCVIALGGDGTLLGIARRLAGTGIPIFGINFGRVGFLTAAERGDWKEKLGSALEGGFPVRECLALKWEISRNGATADNGIAANDVVISRCFPAKVVNINLRIGNFDLGLLRGDGVIVSTPMGSSGYTVSAGGPLLYPGLKAMAITPICPFTPAISPLVFSENTQIRLDMADSPEDCYLTVDGQEGTCLKEHDSIIINAMPDALRFFGDDALFFARLSARGCVLDKSGD